MLFHRRGLLWLGSAIRYTKLPCRKIGQGHHRVMIYTNFVDLHSQMLRAKFQKHRLSGSEEEDFLRFLLFIAMVVILVM